MRATLPKKRYSLKEKRFPEMYIRNGGNATQAVIDVGYKVKNRKVAQSIGTELLSKPVIKAEIEASGFTEDGAKQVVQEIMYNSAVDANARLKATDQVFKVKGSYAPEKSLSVNVDILSGDEFNALLLAFNKKQDAIIAKDERKALGE